MKLPPLATLLSTFFLRYLAVERGVSAHTSTSYRDAIKLLLQFSATGANALLINSSSRISVLQWCWSS